MKTCHNQINLLNNNVKLELVLEIVTRLSLQMWEKDQGLLGVRGEGCRAGNLEGGEKNCPLRSNWRVRLLESQLTAKSGAIASGCPHCRNFTGSCLSLWIKDRICAVSI